MMKLKQGIFIAIEGLDKSGKTSLIKKLKEWLKEYPVVWTREPGGTDLGNIIRNILLDKTYMHKDDNGWIEGKSFMSPKTEALLYAASRQQHADELILPMEEENKLVITDRYIHSNLVYQGIVRGLGIPYILKINPDVFPDLTIILNGDSDKILSRGIRDEDNRYEKEEGKEFHKKCQEGYDEIVEFFNTNLPDIPVVKIDALQSRDEVFEEAKKYIRELVNKYVEGEQ